MIIMRKSLFLFLFLIIIFNVFSEEFSTENKKLSELKSREVIQEISDILETNQKDLIQPKKASPNISFYPLGMLTECVIIGIEFPLTETDAVEVKAGHYEFLDEVIGNKYEFRYRKYTHSGLRKAYAGCFAGYKDVKVTNVGTEDEDYEENNYQDGVYAGMEFGYKMKFSERFYMSNGINFGYSEAAGLLKNEDNNFFFGIDLFKIHFVF